MVASSSGSRLTGPVSRAVRAAGDREGGQRVNGLLSDGFDFASPAVSCADDGSVRSQHVLADQRKSVDVDLGLDHQPSCRHDGYATFHRVFAEEILGFGAMDADTLPDHPDRFCDRLPTVERRSELTGAMSTDASSMVITESSSARVRNCRLARRSASRMVISRAERSRSFWRVLCCHATMAHSSARLMPARASASGWSSSMAI